MRKVPFTGFVTRALATLGAGLLMLSAWGQIWPADYALDYKNGGRRPQDPITFSTTRATLRDIDMLSDRQRLHRLTMLVHARMSNPPASTIPMGAMRVPATENWLLFLAGLAGLAPYTGYTFADPMASLRRGTGLCYQQALTLVGLLEERGISASVQGLNGHVVAVATLEGNDFLLDPDYGLVVPLATGQVGGLWTDIAPLYREQVSTFVDPDVRLRHLAALDSVYRAPPPPAAVPGIAGSLTAEHIATEHLAYRLKWAIPLLLVLLSLAPVASRTIKAAAPSTRPRDERLPQTAS